MKLQTEVSIEKAPFAIEPEDDILFVGSCFADEMGRRFKERQFRCVVNPRGVMYNPVSILHTVEALDCAPSVAVFTLGTNHVYRLKETGEIVDNCQKRPQSLFTEELLSVGECADALRRAIAILAGRNPRLRVVLTVSPIRYQKYGFHGSQLSKATLLLAAEEVVNAECTIHNAQFTINNAQSTIHNQQLAGAGPSPSGEQEGANCELCIVNCALYYFPAYELMNDELRDYRFYRPDMLHPTEQAVDYIFTRFAEACLSPRAHQFIEEWEPLAAALAHKPFNPASEEYFSFAARTQQQVQAFREKWNLSGTRIPIN